MTESFTRPAPFTKQSRAVHALLWTTAILSSVLSIWHVAIAILLGYEDYRLEIQTQRARLFFFWCSIPVASAIISWILVVGNRRRKLFPKPLIYTTLALLTIWILQLALSGTCSWSLYNVGFLGHDLCPYAAASGWNSVRSGMGPGEEQAFIAPWILIPLIVLYVALLVLSIKAKGEVQRVAVDEEKPEVEMRTQQPPRYAPNEMAVEDGRVRNAVVDDEDAISRPPSYRASLETLEESHLSRQMQRDHDDICVSC